MSETFKSLTGGGSGVDFRAWYEKNGIVYGAGDMFVVGMGSPATRVAEIVAMVAGAHRTDNTPAFPEIVVIQAPANARTVDERHKELFGHLDQAVQRSRGRALKPSEIEVLSRRLRIVVAPDLESGSLFPIIAAAKKNSAVVVEEAARYRTTRAAKAPLPVLRLQEDTWVPHFHELCEGAVAAARTSESYIALDANENWPFNEENRNRLLAIDGLAVMAADNPESADAILAQYVARWAEAIPRGGVGSVLKDIDALPEKLDDLKPRLKLQMLYKARLFPMVEQMLRADPRLIEGLPSLLSLQMAEMAAEANAADIATTLLQGTAFEALPKEAIESAMMLAKSVGAAAAAKECETLLQERYPASLILLRARADALAEARDIRGLSKIFADAGDGERAKFYGALAAGLESARPNYEALRDTLIADFTDRVAQACVLIAREAVARGEPEEALLVMLNHRWDEVTLDLAAAVLVALEAGMLTRDKDGEIALDDEVVQAGVWHVIRYVARHPADAGTRTRLATLLSAGSMGLLGLAILIDSALGLAKGPISMRAVRTLDTWAAASSPEETLAFLKIGLPWLQSASPFFLGRINIPAELLTMDADKLSAGISRLLEHYDPLDSPDDLTAVRNALALGMAVAQHGTVPDSDMTLVRMVAVRLALARRFQAARDYAEHGLQIAGDSKARARLAWLAYADVYQRAGNTIEALIGAVCCLAADDNATPEQVFYESVLLYRLLRDLRMVGPSLSFLDAAAAALESFGALGPYAHRIETHRLQARFLLALQDEEHRRERLMALLPEVIRNAHAVLAQGDEPAPAAVNMAEVLRAAEAVGITPPSDAIEALERLTEKSYVPMRETILASRQAHPTARQVLEAVRKTELAREASDTPYDLRQISVLGERLLGSPETLADPGVAAFAVEVLADHGVPPWSAANLRQDWVPSTVADPGKLAAELSAAMELPIVMLGVDADGRLVRCVAEGGTLKEPVRESTEVFSERRLLDWSQRYPFDYGVYRDAFNLFETSTRGVGVGDLPLRAVVVASANIQHWAPNLMRIGDDLAGQTRRLVAAPSLGWLKAARDRRITDRRARAWIPANSSEEGGYTLQMVIDRVSEPLAAHGVTLDTANPLPADLAGCELAIVTAHGSLVPGNRFFQLVSDDADLRMAGSDLSDALKNVGVAVLFVCSGGRLDPHPMAVTTLGLPQQLLANGCGTVIAAPWPIDSRIVSYWLPTFLERWDAGVPVIDAAFEANVRVRDAFNADLRDCLAMSVYGDPLRTKGR